MGSRRRGGDHTSPPTSARWPRGTPTIGRARPAGPSAGGRPRRPRSVEIAGRAGAGAIGPTGPADFTPGRADRVARRPAGRRRL